MTTRLASTPLRTPACPLALAFAGATAQAEILTVDINDPGAPDQQVQDAVADVAHTRPPSMLTRLPFTARPRPRALLGMGSP